MIPTNLDMDTLRTFSVGMELGSFAKAADRLGRSPSAISLQLRKLEEQVGERLVQKSGRGLVLTEAGEILLGYARRILDLNDEARAAVRSITRLDGWVRIGVPQDFAETWLPALLGRFSRMHPKVRIEARVDRGNSLAAAVDKGELDIALTWGRQERQACDVIATRHAVWIGPQGFTRDPSEPLPLVAIEAPCSFRKAAVDALEREGIAWRHAFASPSLAGLWAAVNAGLGVTPRVAEAVPPYLRILDPKEAGLPPLGTLELALHTSRDRPEPPVAELRTLLLGAVG
ncbi:LysR family transcriptional regulator [Neorhizobium sp. T786]|uniref:LysR substrate-binding domain-containing protein n=1 Tax=Pseudorhizobium xiangyangii TaxID=2883104 RepID=UPI001CFFFD1B|nr:LysR substrate-binding domain-containing protein [Neorhizobium xiangyangii]MCB5202776.1 LysR family transcriptional regulator [Neorhizobium xiangyangii]